MAILVSGGPQLEALEYNHVHMLSLTIKQEISASVNDQPVYYLAIVYRLYAVDSEGKKHYGGDIKTVRVPDYLTLAMKKYAVGDLDLINAMAGIEKAMAIIIEEMDGELGNTVVE